MLCDINTDTIQLPPFDPANWADHSRKINRSRAAQLIKPAPVDNEPEVVEEQEVEEEINVVSLYKSHRVRNPVFAYSADAVQQMLQAAINASDYCYGPRRPTLEALVKFVAAKHDVEVNAMKSTRRYRKLSTCRFEFYWLARKWTSRSFPEIARALGGRDHTTVLHGCRRWQEMLDRGDVE